MSSKINTMEKDDVLMGIIPTDEVGTWQCNCRVRDILEDKEKGEQIVWLLGEALIDDDGTGSPCIAIIDVHIHRKGVKHE